MIFMNPSLLIAAGASFIAGAMGYIIVRLWIRPIIGYHIEKRRFDKALSSYLAGADAAAGQAPTKARQKGDAALLRSARNHAMALLSAYHTEIPYWYRLLLDSRRESPARASGLLTNLNKLRDPEQRRARIHAARRELRLNGKNTAKD